MENYQLLMEEILKKEETKGKKLLLHSCCAPCSSYVLTLLGEYFEITVFYYNPNIEPFEEFSKRALEQQNLVRKLNTKYPISVIVGSYDNSVFHELTKGLEDAPERGARCYKCYYERLNKTAMLAKQMHFDYFCSTLSVSPFKNAQWINEIGRILEKEYGVCFLPSDFKKKNGYKESICLSHEYGLYRQNYCGCRYSKKEDNNEKRDL